MVALERVQCIHYRNDEHHWFAPGTVFVRNGPPLQYLQVNAFERVVRGLILATKPKCLNLWDLDAESPAVYESVTTLTLQSTQHIQRLSRFPRLTQLRLNFCFGAIDANYLRDLFLAAPLLEEFVLPRRFVRMLPGLPADAVVPSGAITVDMLAVATERATPTRLHTITTRKHFHFEDSEVIALKRALPALKRLSFGEYVGHGPPRLVAGVTVEREVYKGHAEFRCTTCWGN
jgi:hypothetical protein